MYAAKRVVVGASSHTTITKLGMI